MADNGFGNWDGEDGHQEDEDEHGDDLGPHETGLVVEPAVVVVTVLVIQRKVSNQAITDKVKMLKDKTNAWRKLLAEP